LALPILPLAESDLHFLHKPWQQRIIFAAKPLACGGNKLL
jgi:hypothetical protein